MVKFLITSSDEKTWDVKKQIIFLGEWCKKYSRRNIWGNLNYEMVKPYGISANQKDNDAKLSIEIEKDLIVKIKNELNSIHKVSYDEKMWLILLGPWTKRYASLIVNRSHALKKCMDEFEINETSLLYSDEYTLIKEDSSSSVNSFNDNIWNQHLLYELFKLLDYKNIKINQIKKNIKKSKIKNKYTFKNFILFLIKLFSKYTFFLTNKNSIVIINLYISLRAQLLLHFNLKIFPYFRFIPKKLNLDITPDTQLRNEITEKLIKIKKNPNTKDIAIFLLFKVLPICYLEGFKKLMEIQQKTNFPKNPKYIITSTNCDTDEIFKIWTVNKIITGSKLIIYQHGNNYGTHRYLNPTIDEQISDKFITWGWKKDNKKYVSSQIFKMFNVNINKKNYNSLNKIFLIENTMNPTYYTEDVHHEYNIYFSEQKKFILSLNQNIQKKLIVKLHSSYHIYNVEEDLRWKDFNKNLIIDKGSMKFKNIIKESKIIIFSYDSTGFLEALAYNIPCLAFWQNGLNHIRDSVQKDYHHLIKSEILFLSSQEAAKKINEIYNDVETWWYSERIQKTRKEFCMKYANTTNFDPSLTIKQLTKN